MRRALITGGALIAICAGYGFWYSAATEIRAGIDSWAQDRRRMAGVELGEPTVTGFRLLNLFLQAPVLAGPGDLWR